MSFEQIQSLAPLLQRIDDAQQELNRLKQSHPDAYAQLMESWAVESTYNSNTIEGSTLSLGDTALVFDGIAVDAPITDIRQAEGGFAALRFLESALSNRDELSVELIKRAHEYAFAEAMDPATRGRYRATEVEITGTTFQPTPCAYVAERMDSLVASTNNSKRHPAITSALFHLEFESIHPFVNANGRTGRLICNFILMRAGFEPINIQAESRQRYVNALRSFQLDDDPFPFVEFFCKNLLECQERVLAILKPSSAVGSRASGSSALTSPIADALIATDPVSDPVSDPVAKLLAVLGDGELSTAEIMDALGLAHRTHFRRNYLAPALEGHLIEMTIPEKPHSRNQKYRRAGGKHS